MVTARKNKAIAFVLALLSHASFLLLNIDVKPSRESGRADSQGIRIQLVDEIIKKKLPQPLNQEASVSDNHQTTPSDQDRSQSQTPETRISVIAPDEKQAPISVESDAFKQFIRSELQREEHQSPSALEHFSKSFKPYFEPPKVKPAIDYAQGPLGGGQYKVYKKGKVYCVLQMVPLSFDEMNGYGFIGASQDCSPQQKFDLNLK